MKKMFIFIILSFVVFVSYSEESKVRVDLKSDMLKFMFETEKEIVLEYLLNNDVEDRELLLNKIMKDDVILLNQNINVKVIEKDGNLIGIIEDVELCKAIYEEYTEITGKYFYVSEFSENRIQICWKEFIEVLKKKYDEENPSVWIWEKVITEVTKCIEKPDNSQNPEDGYIPEHNPDDVYPIPNPNRE